MKQKLNAKDFILIGVLTALMWIICMIISTITGITPWLGTRRHGPGWQFTAASFPAL